MLKRMAAATWEISAVSKLRMFPGWAANIQSSFTCHRWRWSRLSWKSDSFLSYWLSIIFGDLMGGYSRSSFKSSVVGTWAWFSRSRRSIRRLLLHYQSHLSIDTCFQASFEGAVGGSLGLR